MARNKNSYSIIPFNDLFNPVELTKINFDIDNCFIHQISLVDKIINSKLPIDNIRIALKNILLFLYFLDNEIDKLDNKEKIVVIDKTIFAHYFTNDKYIAYQKLLSDLKVISAVPYEDGSFFQMGKSFKRYRVHNEYLKEKDLALITFDEKKKSYNIKNSIPELDYRYVSTIQKLDIDIHKAVFAEIVNHQTDQTDLSNLKLRVNRVFATKRDRFIKKGNKVNRVYHSFSNISKVSRKYFNIQFTNIDIVNCQPLLLVYYLKSNNLPVDSNYITDCEQGIIYERFISEQSPRELVKVLLYKSIFFNFNTRINVNAMFKYLYPLTWSSLEKIKAESDLSGKKLAGQLQNIEAELFNALTPAGSEYYFTLFDSIYFDDTTDSYKLESDIRNFFNKMGISPKMKKEF